MLAMSKEHFSLSDSDLFPKRFPCKKGQIKDCQLKWTKDKMSCSVCGLHGPDI